MSSTFSIIIPTFKRKEHVKNLLESLKGKITNNTEVIIVEQKENHKREFEKVAKELGIPLSYYFLSQPSTPRAKNIGAAHAKGDYLIFFDDDVLLKTPIEPFLEAFQNKKIAAVNGRSVARGQKEEPERDDVGKVSFLGTFTDGYSSKIPQEIETFIGCNVCFRKNIFQEVGGYDEQFTGNAIREEADLSCRVRKRGYAIYFNPTVEVLHVRAELGGTRKTEGRIQWYFDFFSNETYFFLKYWPYWAVLFIMLTRWEWALRCMLGFGREVSLRSLTTPFAGILDGYAKYRRWQNENRS